jgi:hypothetical protein
MPTSVRPGAVPDLANASRRVVRFCRAVKIQQPMSAAAIFQFFQTGLAKRSMPSDRLYPFLGRCGGPDSKVSAGGTPAMRRVGVTNGMNCAPFRPEGRYRCGAETLDGRPSMRGAAGSGHRTVLPPLYSKPAGLPI